MIKWSWMIDTEPEFNPDFPTDPVDWECSLHSEDGGMVVYVTFTGTIEEDDETVTPWNRDDVELMLTAMTKGLNQ